MRSEGLKLARAWARGVLGILAFSLWGLLSLPANAAGTPEAEVLRGLLAADHGGYGDMQLPLARFYGERQFEPVWFKGVSPRPEVRQALDILRQAESHGLEVGDYPLPDLFAARDGQARGAADLALSLSLFRYLSDLHAGRVRLQSLGVQLDIAVRRPDLPVLVAAALAQGRLSALPESMAPPFPLYGQLRLALVRYRDLARGEFQTLPPVKKKLEPGQDYPALSVLRDRLVRLGDLPPTAGLPPRYEGELVEGVKHFQARHGLEPDGVIGRGSFTELNVPFSARVRQIELSLERLRWLRVPDGPKVVGVNIPEFRLRAFDIRGGQVMTRFSMKIIVGQAVLAKKTPIFDEDMRTIDFKPFWNVPPSIARAELVPKLRKDPGHFREQDMEVVPAKGGKPSTELSPEVLDAVAKGTLRIRQKPGAKNPLGPIKFVLPNNHDVYLHYTSSPRLFQKSRRDFSHGCIRLEEPVKLASFVLEDQPDWTEEKIRAAMAADKPSTVRLTNPVPVVIFYTTVVQEQDGQLHFFPDIYGLDAKLDAALKQRSFKRPVSRG